jgi:hypothetical protein
MREIFKRSYVEKAGWRDAHGADEAKRRTPPARHPAQNAAGPQQAAGSGHATAWRDPRRGRAEPAIPPGRILL